MFSRSNAPEIALNLKAMGDSFEKTPKLPGFPFRKAGIISRYPDKVRHTGIWSFRGALTPV
jgi:hypothetical protein